MSQQEDRENCEKLYVEYMRTECMSLGWDKEKCFSAKDVWLKSCVEYREKYGETV